MDDKPHHLQPQYAAQFHDASVVAAYGYRPPVPDEVLTVLLGLVRENPAHVLDIGCGRGELARPLATCVSRVDAVDWSSAMIAMGKQLPGGDRTNLHWAAGKAEEAPLAPPYVLVTAGQSLHWMDWDVILPRIATALTPNGFLAIVGREVVAPRWHRALRPLIQRLSTNQDYQPYDLIEELTRRQLFTVSGRYETAPTPFRQPVDDYIESFHARKGLSRDRMTPVAAAAFDREVRALCTPFAENGQLALMTVGEIIWDRPQTPNTNT
jgi:SAM-dependent methyltransferase